jgi:PKD repeat protein
MLRKFTLFSVVVPAFCLFLSMISGSALAQCTADAGSNVTICPTGSTTIGGAPTASGGSGTYTYSWSSGGSLSCNNCPNPVADPNSTTTYTVTIDDGNGCVDTDQITVTVSPNPNAGFTFAPNNQCSSTPVSFTNTSTGGGLTYQWDFGNPASGGSNASTDIHPEHTFIAPGSGTESFTVTLTVTTSAGCTDVQTHTVNVQQSPVPDLQDPLTSWKNCDGSNFTVTMFNMTNPANNTSYTIDWGDGTADFTAAGTFASATHTYTTQGIFDVTFTVEGTNGCITTETYLVSNITNPAIGVANPGGTNGCGPLTLCFPLSNFGTNHPSTIYTIDYGDGSDIDTIPHAPPNQICHTYTESSCGLGGAYTFTISAINACDISVATINPIRVYIAPEAHFTPAPVPQCVNVPVVFTNTSILGFNSTCSQSTVFTWDFGDGSPTVMDLTGVPQAHAYTAPGTYSVTLSAQNSCGTSTESHDVCIESPPVPAFTLIPPSDCVPFGVTVNNTSDTSNSCNTSYLWTTLFNGSSCAPGTSGVSFSGGTASDDWEPMFQFTNAGDYTVQLTLTNSCGAVVSTQPVIANTIPEITPAALTAICAGQSVSPTATFADCDLPITAYSWTFPGGSPASAAVEVPGSVTFNTAGSINIGVSATNGCGTATASVPLTVSAPPAIPDAAANTPLCEGETLNLSTTTSGAGITYSWSGPGGFTSTSQNPSIPLVTAANAGTYSLSIADNGCPSNPATVNVVITTAPVVTVTPASASFCEGDDVVLTASGATSYTWSPATGLSATTGAVVTADPTVTTTYTVVGTTGGCDDSETVTVTVNPLPVVAAGPDLTLCNQPIAEQLTGSPAGGTWSGPDITAAGEFMPTAVGVFTVTYTYTDGNNCTASDDVEITVNDPAVIVMPADETVCLNDPVFTINATPAGGTWSGTNVSTTGDYNPITAGTFTLTYTLGTGTCASSGTMDVTVNALPVVNAGTDINVCVDAGIQALNGTPAGGTWTGTGVTGTNFNPSVAGSGSFALTYEYTDIATGCDNSDALTAVVNTLPVVTAGPDITLCDQPVGEQLTGTPAGGTWSGSNITAGGMFTPSGTGTFTVTYTYTDGNNCTSTDDADVTVVAPVPADAGNDMDACINDPAFNLTATPAGGSWSGPNITAGGTFTPVTAGTFTVTYTFGTGSCLTTDDVDITVNALPVVNAGSDQTVCVDAVPFDLTGSPAGGSWSGTGITNAANGTFSPAVSGIGTFTATYSFTDGNGCSNTDNADVFVNALPVVDAGNDTTLCDQPIPVSFSGSPAGGTWSGSGITAGGAFTPSGVGSFTVTYTYTLGTGCSASDDRTITVVAPVPADAGLDLEACINDPATGVTGLPAGGTWSGTGVTAAGVFTPSMAGIFNLTYSFGAGNCATTDDMVFTVHALPVVNAGPDDQFCVSDGPVNFSGSPAGGTWSGTGITNAALGTFDPGTGAGTYTIVYTYTDPVTSCLNRDTLEALVNPLPVPSFTNNPVACIGNPELFTNTTSGGSTWQWDFGDGGTSVASDPSHSWSATGFYDVQLIATSAAGCVDSITTTIEVREPPVAFFTLLPDSGCAPLQVSFTNLSSGVGITESWDFGDGTAFAGTNPPDVTYQQGVLADSTYYITLSVTNFCGTVTHTDSVIVMPSPTAIFGPQFSVGCSPYNALIANNSLGLPDTYEWDFGDGTFGTQDDSLFVHTFYTGTEDTVYTMMLIVTNECGVDTAYHDVTVLPNSVNAFFNTPVTSGCEPLTINFTQFSTGGLFFSWDFGDGNTSLAANPTHTFTTAGTYTVQLFVNDGCSYDTAQAVIEVFPSPPVDFSWAPDSVCANVPFQFTNLSGPLAGVSWDFGDGSTSTLNDPQHAYSSSGSYTVTLFGTSLTNGCVGSVSHTITVANNPVASFTILPDQGCIPLPVTMTNTSTNAQFYQWNFGDGNTSIAVNPSHTYSSDGIYMVQLIAVNVNGCTDTAYMPVNAFPLPVASFTVNNTDPCYQPVSALFNNTSTGASGYQWNFGNGQTSVLNNPSTTYNTPADYTVELIATNTYGCTDTAYDVVEIFQLPTADFTVDTSAWCALYPLGITNNSLFADNVVWDYGTGTSTDFNPEIIFQDSGVYDISLIVTTADGCSDTMSLPAVVQIFPTPTAAFSYENIHEPDPLSGTVAFTNESEGAISYQWEFGNGSSTEEHPIHRFEKFGDLEVMLIAINEYGCPDTLYEVIQVMYFKGLFFPNVLSYGHNNYELGHFIPKGVGLRTFYVGVYDTWGNLMWECRELDADGRPLCAWDGTYQGKPVPQDAYVWRAEATYLDESLWEGQEYPTGILRASGTVTVLR